MTADSTKTEGSRAESEKAIKTKIGKTQDLIDGVLQRQPLALGKAITLLESDSPEHWAQGDDLLEKLQALNTQSTLRIGLSGPPGVGKSTFLESFGCWWVNQGKSIAVIAIDPSSEKTGGSILGDKTRMSQLAKKNGAFIRPSANRGRLGGVHSSLPSVLLLLEKAGFDLIVVETVGVGQSEVSIHSMVDQLILLMQPGAGDDLQAIKKGLLEFGDVFLVGKADRAPDQARQSLQHLLSSLKILKGRECPVFSVSGVEASCNEAFFKFFPSLQVDPVRREQMAQSWFQHLLESRILALLRDDPTYIEKKRSYEQRLSRGETLPPSLVREYLSKEVLKTL